MTRCVHAYGLRAATLLLAASLAAGLAGCGAADNDGQVFVPMDTVAGAIVVRNGTAGVWGPGEAWAVREEFRIGAIEGEEWKQFGSLSGLAIGPQGEIAAIDFQAQQIRLFARDGAFLAQIGGPGGGPGEFDGPLAVAWDPHGRLWVVDGWNRRYTLFDAAGAVLKTIERRVVPAGFRQRLVFHSAGEPLDETNVRMPDGSLALAIVRVDTMGAVLDTFPPLVRPELGGASIFPFPSALNPYRPGLKHTLTSDGRLWFTDSDHYRPILRTLAGDTVRIVETSHRGGALGRTDEQLIERELRKVGAATSGYRFGRQVVQGLHTLDDGHLLVLIEPGPGDDARVIDIFDPQGRFLGTAVLAFTVDRRVAPAFRGDTMIAVTRDELGVQYIVRAVLERGAMSISAPPVR